MELSSSPLHWSLPQLYRPNTEKTDHTGDKDLPERHKNTGEKTQLKSQVLFEVKLSGTEEEFVKTNKQHKQPLDCGAGEIAVITVPPSGHTHKQLLHHLV